MLTVLVTVPVGQAATVVVVTTAVACSGTVVSGAGGDVVVVAEAAAADWLPPPVRLTARAPPVPNSATANATRNTGWGFHNQLQFLCVPSDITRKARQDALAALVGGTSPKDYRLAGRPAEDTSWKLMLG